MKKKNLAKAITLGLLLAMPCQAWAESFDNGTYGNNDMKLYNTYYIAIHDLYDKQDPQVESITDNIFNLDEQNDPTVPEKKYYDYKLAHLNNNQSKTIKINDNIMNVTSSIINKVSFFVYTNPTIESSIDLLGNNLIIDNSTITNEAKVMYMTNSWIDKVEGKPIKEGYSINIVDSTIKNSIGYIQLVNNYDDNNTIPLYINNRPEAAGIINSINISLNGETAVGSYVYVVNVSEDHRKAVKQISNNTVTLSGKAAVNGALYSYRDTTGYLALNYVPAKYDKNDPNSLNNLYTDSNGNTFEVEPAIAYNNSLVISEDWIGQNLTTLNQYVNNKSVSTYERTLNNVQNFDTIEVLWTHDDNASDDDKKLKITSLTANTLNGASGENDPLNFKLNHIDTKVEIGNFTNGDNEKVILTGTDNVRNQFGDGISDVKNISEDDKERLNAFAQAVTANEINGVATNNENKYLTNKLMLEESNFHGAWEAEVVNGKVQIETAKSSENNANIGAVQMSNLALISLKQQTNDMNKRMGELRNANGEHGVWVRMVRGESDYKNIDSQYNQYQLGYDEKLSVDKRWTVGAAVSYTEADNSFERGSGETDNTAFAIYGSKLNNDGSFVDLIAKYARIENDFKLTGASIGNGDYGVNSYSISAEVGKRFEQGNGFWLEPQAELSYGKVASVNYRTTNNVDVHQDSSDILIGRLGFSLGKDIKQGNVYARASYLYDFEGDASLTMIDNVSGATKKFTDDLGGGWWEVGVGANINLSKATYIYADVEKTFGGEVDTNWQWNLGVRYSF